MSHLFKCLGLLLLLMSVQQGAILHELSHAAHVGASSLEAQVGGLEEANCALCPAFAQAAAAALGHTFPLPLPDRSVPHLVAAREHAAIDAAIPRPRSRGPPSLS